MLHDPAIADRAAGLTAVVDPRYVHPAVSLGWRKAHASAGRELRGAIENAVLRNPTLTDALSFDWEIDDGADVFTALLPQSRVGSWMQTFVRTMAHADVHQPVVSVVGGEAAVASVRSAWAGMRMPQSQPDAAHFTSFMTHARARGSTTVTVTGRDPVDQWGSAATALAVHLAQTRLPLTALPESAPEAFRLMRHLHQETPAVSWQIGSHQHRALLLLQTALDELTAHRRSGTDEAFAQARGAIEDQMWEYRRSPVQFARSLTRHAVMGWGAELVRDPAGQLSAARMRDVDAAYLALLRPIAEVLGQT